MSISIPIEILKLKGTALTIAQTDNLVKDILDHIKEAYPNFYSLKNNISFYSRVAKLVYNSVKNAGSDANQQQITITILQQLFNLNTLEVEIATQALQHFEEIGSITKVDSTAKWVYKSFKNLFKKKILSAKSSSS